ncbi:helix-turn-helix domain-containing protein [Paenibacillus sp. GCM10023252]|uniref:helix-turn-helix domain-containing protein n=1 Tax=Paenibacillus sp. GCM10023252 TaxID=3252649 RepID=UPI0036120053
MNQEFMNRFIPRINGIFLRDEQFWNWNGHEVIREVTQLCNIGYVLSGEGTMELNDTSYPLRSGCCYQFSPAGVRLRMTSNPASPLVYMAIHFDYKLATWEGSSLFTSEPHASIPLPHWLELDNTARAEELFRGLYQMWNEQQQGYEWRARLGLIALLGELEELQGRPSLSERQLEEAIRGAMLHVHQHYRNPAHREDMARQCSVSLSYFSTLFKQYTGYSYLQYIHKIRLEKAKTMLLSSSLPISAIAAEVGYEDPLYFSKLFSREAGLSPREYRKE